MVDCWASALTAFGNELIGKLKVNEMEALESVETFEPATSLLTLVKSFWSLRITRNS